MLNLDLAVVLDIQRETLADRRTIAKFLRGEMVPTARNAALRTRLAAAVAKRKGSTIATGAEPSPIGGERAA